MDTMEDGLLDIRRMDDKGVDIIPAVQPARVGEVGRMQRPQALEIDAVATRAVLRINLFAELQRHGPQLQLAPDNVRRRISQRGDSLIAPYRAGCSHRES